MSSLVCRIAAVLLLAASPPAFGVPPGSASEASPFDPLIGRWVGEGRLGVRSGKTEAVRCRVTYIASGGPHQVRQTIRCASEGDSVEVQSTVTHSAGTIKGTWQELSRNLRGELEGQVTPRGFKVAITGSDLRANMDILVRDGRQIIEIQFLDSTLIGLTLILTKG